MIFVLDAFLLVCSIGVSLHIRRALASGQRKVARKNQQDIFKKVYSSDFLLVSAIIAATFFLKLIRDITVFILPSVHMFATVTFLILNAALSAIALLLLYKVISKK